jgi:hypothetical protein
MNKWQMGWEWHLIQIPLSDFVEQGTFEDDGLILRKIDWKSKGTFTILLNSRFEE